MAIASNENDSHDTPGAVGLLGVPKVAAPAVDRGRVAARPVVWRFPSAEMVDAAASFFPHHRPTELEVQAVLWDADLPAGVRSQHVHLGSAACSDPGGADPRSADDAGGESWSGETSGRSLPASHSYGEAAWIETATPLEGLRYVLRISPGNIQVYRRDQAKAERTRARLADERIRRAVMDELVDAELGSRPLAFRTDIALEHSRKDGPAEISGAVTAWSAKSRRSLVKAIGELDLAPIVGNERPPALVTLTLPGDWQAVCPDAATGTALLKRFEKRYARRWGVPLRCIWKREFQRRGAPHWHLWLCPPGEPAEFARWLSEAWTMCLGITGPEERRRSLAAGTGLDYLQAADMHDPRRLAFYFLKETLGGESKAYQNQAPAEWAGQSVGRFWGVKGLDKAIADVPLPQEAGVRLWRVLRRQRAQERVVRRKLRCTREHSHTRRCYRVQRRQAVAPPAAGWLSVNDGPSVAVMLSRLVGEPSRGSFGWAPVGHNWVSLAGA